MKIDIVTIFPAWFDSLDVSLTGRARASGLLDLAVHDLRDWTHDRHRTVDDTPYGGGAGMVMKPEPWGEALDALRRRRHGRREAGRPCSSRPRAGSPFTQALAASSPVTTTSSSPAAATRGSTSASSTRPPRRTTCARSPSATTSSTAARSRPPPSLEAVVRLLPGLHGQPRVADRGVPRGRPPGVPRLHQARLLARPRGAARAALGRPRGDRGLAPCRVRTTHRRAPTRPRAPGGPGRPRRPRPSTSPRPPAPMPASCSP